MSLSARRAWIEISVTRYKPTPKPVALRKESVDRNLWWGVRKAVGSLSLSARRAWIEIQGAFAGNKIRNVALRKESVDRNGTLLTLIIGFSESLSARRAWIEMQQSIQLFFVLWGRSPQGERG